MGNVPASRMRNCQSCPNTTYRVGQRVYGNYRGEGYWYGGRISGGNNRTGYNVRLDDGDTMTSASGCLIRRPTGNWMNLGGRYRIGQVVRARHMGARGGTRCYPARVCGSGSQRNTWRICYNDGDKEDNVDARHISPRNC